CRRREGRTGRRAARTGSPRVREASPRRPTARSFVPVLRVVVLVLVEIVEGVVDLVPIVVVLVVEFELERIERRDAQAATAGIAVRGAADLHLVEIVVVYFEFGVALRTGRHTVSSISGSGSVGRAPDLIRGRL